MKSSSLVPVGTLLISSLVGSDAYAYAPTRSANGFGASGRTSGSLRARRASRRGGRGGRRGRPTDEKSGRGRRNIDGRTEGSSRGDHSGTEFRPPSKTKMSTISLVRSSSDPALEVCVAEADDEGWWEDANNENPYGARLWPPSLAVARFLARHLADAVPAPRRRRRRRRQRVIELGCGTGVVSIAAAGCGADALATDVSTAALFLTREGWIETRGGRRRGGGDDVSASESSGGTLSTAYFDILSSEPLPLPLPSPPPPRDGGAGDVSPPIVVAAAVLYERDLAGAVARRVAEACSACAWVILGDDDTGLREGGRERFEAKLDGSWDATEGAPLRRSSIEMVVKEREFGWAEKRVWIHHFNAPPGVSLE